MDAAAYRLLGRTAMTPDRIDRSFAGKVALVTGSGRGLGAATVLRFAAAGADVIVNDIEGDRARAVVDQAEALGARALLSTHDVSQHAAAEDLVAAARARFGTVHILVNNAGITRDALLHRLDEARWDEVIGVNLKGPFNVGKACVRLMMDQRYGRIVNIASLAWLGNVGQTNYAASKAGIVGLTRTWALELGRHGITVNAVAPGFIDSVLTRQVPPPIHEKFVRKIPIGRIGEPDDIARAVTFLAGDDAAYISGQCLHVDGALSVGIAGAWY